MEQQETEEYFAHQEEENEQFEREEGNEDEEENRMMDDDENQQENEEDETFGMNDDEQGDGEDRFMDQAEMEQLIKKYHSKKRNPLEHQQAPEEQTQEFNTVHSTNSQNLIEQITRNKIFNSIYYKEECFGLNAATVIDKAEALDSIGGTYGGLRRPTNFLCLLMKMLQIEVDLESSIAYIHNGEFKYLTALGALYLRLVGNAVDIYEQLEPLYSDYRKLRLRLIDGSCKILHMDEYVEMLLTSDSFCDIKLPFLLSRKVLERNGKLNPYISELETNEEYKAVVEKMNRKEPEQQSENISKTDSVAEVAVPESITPSPSTNTPKKSGSGFKLNLKKKSSANQQDSSSTNASEKSSNNNNGEISLSIEETNKLRISLGMKPISQ